MMKDSSGVPLVQGLMNQAGATQQTIVRQGSFMVSDMFISLSIPSFVVEY
jgi:hypothetical protein